MVMTTWFAEEVLPDGILGILGILKLNMFPTWVKGILLVMIERSFTGNVSVTTTPTAS